MCTHMEQSIRFNLDYDLWYAPFMTDQHWYFAYALYKHFGKGKIIGLVDNSNNSVVVVHCIYKIDTIYIDIRGIFTSFDEIVNEPTKIKQLGYEHYSYYLDHLDCVEEDVTNNLNLEEFVKSSSFDFDAYSHAKNIIDIIIKKYPYLKKFEK